MTTTTQLEKVNVTVKNVMDWAISNQAPEMVKAQRLGASRSNQVIAKCGTPVMGEDIVSTSDESRCSESGYAVTMRSEEWFDTGNVRYKARERYSFGFSDPLGVWGSQ